MESNSSFCTSASGFASYPASWNVYNNSCQPINYSINQYNIDEYSDDTDENIPHFSRYQILLSYMKCVCNWEEKTIFRRSFRDFTFLFSFYITLYLFLFGFCVLMMWPFFQFVLSEDYPHLQGKHSLLRGNPGLSVVPTPDHLTALIAFKMSDRHSYSKYVDSLKAFTEYYEDRSLTQDDFLKECYRDGADTDVNDRASCKQSLNIGGSCNSEQEFGFNEGMPCVVIKLNRIHGWLPEIYENTTGVEIKCEGQTEADKQHIGELCYYDDNTLNINDVCNKASGVLKSYYFPYLGQRNYQSPIVFVEFREIKRFVVVMVECWAIAKNIKVDTARSEGSVRFELYVY